MTNYSDNPGMVRVDFFKPSGKWYMTEAVDMRGYWGLPDIHMAVRQSLDESRPDCKPGWWTHFTVVVAEPYHQTPYPIMIVAKEDA